MKYGSAEQAFDAVKKKAETSADAIERKLQNLAKKSDAAISSIGQKASLVGLDGINPKLIDKRVYDGYETFCFIFEEVKGWETINYTKWEGVYVMPSLEFRVKILILLLSFKIRMLLSTLMVGMRR